MDSRTTQRAALTLDAVRVSARPRRHTLQTLIAIALGGVAGAEARYGIGAALPHTTSQFPWATLIVNASGCLLIGALMVLLLELTSPHRLARPFLGVGVLGGYTTFSTFSVEAERLMQAHRAGIALGYSVATPVTCLAAVWLGTMGTQLAGRMIIEARQRRRGGR